MGPAPEAIRLREGVGPRRGNRRFPTRELKKPRPLFSRSDERGSGATLANLASVDGEL